MKNISKYPLENESVTQTLPVDIKEELNREKTKSQTEAQARKKTKVYEPRPLTPQDPIYEEIMEQFASRPVKPKYWFEEFGDYWSCSCGHINRGDTCVNCGLSRNLLRQLFILHKPASVASELEGKVAETKNQIDTEAKYVKDTSKRREQVKASDIDDIKPIEIQSPDFKSGKGNHIKRNIIIAAILLVLLASCGVGYYYYKYIATPAMEYEDGVALMESGDYDAAIEKFTALGEYEDTKSLIRQCHILIGDKLLEDEDYDGALKEYQTAQDMKDDNEIQNRINDLKFAYVKANEDKGGDTFEAYLSELKDISYPGINKIYDKYYEWHMTIIANTSESDFSTKKTDFTTNDTVYFHVKLSGGEPGERISLYYQVTWPSGTKESQDLNNQYKTGSKITAHFAYPIGLLGKAGQLRFAIYDSDSNKELASKTINFISSKPDIISIP